MPESERQKMIRQYAAGDITWRVLRESGFENYVEVLARAGRAWPSPPYRCRRGAKCRGARDVAAALIRRGPDGAAMSEPFSLIVTDTSPLFTLVLADAPRCVASPGLRDKRSPTRFTSKRRGFTAHPELTRSSSGSTPIWMPCGSSRPT